MPTPREFETLLSSIVTSRELVVVLVAARRARGSPSRVDADAVEEALDAAVAHRDVRSSRRPTRRRGSRCRPPLPGLCTSAPWQSSTTFGREDVDAAGVGARRVEVRADRDLDPFRRLRARDERGAGVRRLGRERGRRRHEGHREDDACPQSSHPPVASSHQTVHFARVVADRRTLTTPRRALSTSAPGRRTHRGRTAPGDSVTVLAGVAQWQSPSLPSW